VTTLSRHLNTYNEACSGSHILERFALMNSRLSVECSASHACCSRGSLKTSADSPGLKRLQAHNSGLTTHLHSDSLLSTDPATVS
jgi:hypothetical protein